MWFFSAQQSLTCVPHHSGKTYRREWTWTKVVIVDGMVIICFSFLLIEQVWTWYITIIIYHFNYNYIPETNHVSRVYSVAAILWLQFFVCVMQFSMINILYFYISTLQSVCAQCPMWLFSVGPWCHAFQVY